jgi:hypothetical protein
MKHVSASAPPLNVPGGTTTRNALTGQQIEMVTRAAHKALAERGEQIGPSKIARVIRRFGHALNRSRMTFHEFLCNEANRPRLLLQDPELVRVIAYLDPTGETAVNNVLRQRSRRENC